METKHTPGTWEVDGEFVGPVGQRDVGICHVLPMEDEYGHGWARGPITKANSHLIAAAPDMLAALYEVEIYLSERSDVIDGDYGQPAPNAEMVLLAEVQSAIRRATHWMPLPASPTHPAAAQKEDTGRFVACRCVSERDRELCMTKDECSKVYAYSDTATKEPTK